MNEKLPISLKIAASYLILAAAVGILVPILGFGHDHPEFHAQSIDYKIRAYTRDHLFNLMYLVSGIAIFARRLWGRRLALFSLVGNFFVAANAFAWGFAEGEPSKEVRLLSYAIVGTWNGIWFYLLAKRSSRLALKASS